MSKYIYILLLIEFIKNYENIDINSYNNSNNTLSLNPLEINKTIDLYHTGIELNISSISSFSPVEQEILFYYDFNLFPLPKYTTFAIFFNPSSENYTFKSNLLDIKCLYLDININLSDVSNINILNNISNNKSKCYGFFDKGNKNKYNGIIYNNKYNYLSYKKLLFIIKYNWEDLTEIKIYLRNNIYNLSYIEGIIKEKEEYTLIPYYINLNYYRNISNEIILYSSSNNLYLYYLNEDNFSKNNLLYKGNIILLYTDKYNIDLKYDKNEEMILFTNSLFDDINNSIEYSDDNGKNDNTNNYNWFEIAFSFENMKIINYYYFTKFPNGKQISLQMIEQNVKYCFILNYQKVEQENNTDNIIINEKLYKTLYIQLIYGQINSLKIYNINNNNTLIEFLKNGQNLTINDLFYITNNNQENNYINMICAENNNNPSLIYFYYSNEEIEPILSNSSKSLIELTTGDSYVTNLQKKSLYNLSITKIDNEINMIDFNFHVFNKENKINIEIKMDDDIIVIEQNNIKKFNLKVKNETKKNIIIYNKGNYNCNIIIKIGLEINENDEIKNINGIIYNMKYDLYYFKFPILYQEYKYSKIVFNIISNNKYCISDSINTIFYPISDNLHLNNSFYELINPYIIQNDYISVNNNINYYLIIKTYKPYDNITITLKFEKYDFFTAIKVNFFFILKIQEKDKNKKGIIIPYENRSKSYIQMFSCNNNLISFEIYDNIYKTYYTTDKLPSEQYIYYSIEENIVDLSISFINEEKELKDDNIFINHFIQSKALNEKINKFKIHFNNITNSISLEKPLNTSFNYTIFLDKKGYLLDKNINLCYLYTFTDLNDITYYVKNISEVDFAENEYKLNFTSEVLKNYKSFDMFILAKEISYGMIFLSNIISNEYIEEAIIINNIINNTDNNMLYYFGKMELLNYYKIGIKGYYETIITIHFGNNFDINKINIDCAQIKSNSIKDIKIAMIEQKNKEICKILNIKNEIKNNIVNIFVKMVKYLYDSLALRILNDNINESCDIAIYMDTDDLKIKKEIIIDDEEENKIITINHPFCFKYYKLYLDDINNNKYNQIGLYSNVKNSLLLLINNDYNEKILIDYGNFIIINTNEDYIINNYYQNKELIVVIGDFNKQILNINDIDIGQIKLNIIGLTKKNNTDIKNKINFIDYYTFNDLINLNDIFVPLYINKCDKNLNNFIVLNFKLSNNININNKKYIKINIDFGEIPMIKYSNMLNKDSFNDVVDNLISINLKEKNLILFENNIYIFKIVCTNYIYMNINIYEIRNEIKQDSYILESGSSLDIPLKYQDVINLDFNELKNSNLTKIELSNELINFDVDAEIDKKEIINLNSNNRILLLKLDQKEIKKIKLKANNKKGYIKILTNINNNELKKEEANNYLSYNNKELYIYSHKIEPNNDLIKISIPILNKDKSKYISVCYYLSQIIFKNKNISNCIKISENSFENITIRNPYNTNDNKEYNISDLFIIFYKDGKNNDNKLELKDVIIEEEGKNNKEKRENDKNGENSSTKVGRFVLIFCIIIIIFFIIFLLFIYIKKFNIKKKEMNYRTTINNENELLAQVNNNNYLSGNIFSLND